MFCKQLRVHFFEYLLCIVQGDTLSLLARVRPELPMQCFPWNRCRSFACLFAISIQHVTGSIFAWVPPSEVDLEMSLVQVVSLGCGHYPHQ